MNGYKTVHRVPLHFDNDDVLSFCPLDNLNERKMAWGRILVSLIPFAGYGNTDQFQLDWSWLWWRHGVFWYRSLYSSWSLFVIGPYSPCCCSLLALCRPSGSLLSVLGSMECFCLGSIQISLGSSYAWRHFISSIISLLVVLSSGVFGPLNYLQSFTWGYSYSSIHLGVVLLRSVFFIRLYWSRFFSFPVGLAALWCFHSSSFYHGALPQIPFLIATTPSLLFPCASAERCYEAPEKIKTDLPSRPQNENKDSVKSFRQTELIRLDLRTFSRVYIVSSSSSTILSCATVFLRRTTVSHSTSRWGNSNFLVKLGWFQRLCFHTIHTINK